MKISAWAGTDKGLRRESNQDSYLVNETLNVFIVADGMGGHSGGEVASSLAVSTVEDFIAKNSTVLRSSRELMIRAVEAASRRIFDKAATESPELIGMGTTLVMALVSGHSIFIANVGDSRAYLFQKPHMWQLTEDHSLVYEQLRSGAINESQLKSFVGKNVITRSVGYERDVIADVLERPLASGDQIMLCSDGLSGLVSDEEISKVLNENKGQKAVDALIRMALANGGDDNVTVVLVEVN
jgi:serine/threonine protein phosphatase PrpC